MRGASCRSYTRVLFCFQVFYLGHQSILVFYEQPGNSSDLNSVLMLPVLEIEPPNEGGMMASFKLT